VNAKECRKTHMNGSGWELKGNTCPFKIEFPYWEWIFLRCFESLDQGLGYQILSNI
jgi:hypothetical protein